MSVQGSLSKVLCLLCGLPQVLGLGPVIFTMYTRPLGIIDRRFAVGYHFCADDTQLYVSFRVGSESNVPSSLKNMEHGIADIRI